MVDSIPEMISAKETLEQTKIQLDTALEEVAKAKEKEIMTI